MTTMVRDYPSVPKPKPYTPPQAGPGYDGEPLTEVTLKDPDGDGKRELTADRRVDILDRLVEAGTLEAYHRDAGRKFQNDAEACEASCSSAGEFMCGGHGTAYTFSEAALLGARRVSEARARLRGAMTELGPYGEVFAVAVLLNRASFLDACRFCGWPREMGPHALREVLYQLAKFYGVAPSVGDHRVRGWSAEP